MKTPVRFSALLLAGALAVAPVAAPAAPAPDAFAQALSEGRHDAALRAAQQLLQEPGNAGALDSLSYRLVTAGGKPQALHLLLEAWPFTEQHAAVRTLLVQRVALLATEQPDSLTPPMRARLAAPLETPALRAAQAALFAALGDCATVTALLADRSPDYGADAWLRLGQCQSDPDAAIAALQQAQRLAPADSNMTLQIAYAHERAGRLAEARAGFEAVRAQQPDNAALTEQLVYVSLRQGDDAAARDYARQAIEARQKTSAPEADHGDPALYGLRRLHEDLGRRWVFSADLSTGAGQVDAGSSLASGTTYRSYLQLEAEYRLGTERLHRGLVSPYLRLFAGSGEEDSALPVYSPMVGAGLRLRPWRSQNVAFAIEPQLPLDNGPAVEADVMLHASGSWLDGGRFSNEWHAAGSGWLTQTLYLDAARFLDAELTAATADYRLGRHFKRRAGETLEPYAHLQYNVLDASARDEDVRGGIGLRWHRWHDESRLDAWRRKTTVALEYQHAFHTWFADTDSVALIVGTRW